jgi:hypothetical protein
LHTSRHGRLTGEWDQVRSFARDPDAIDRHRDLLETDDEYRRAIEMLCERGVGKINRYGIHRRIRRADNLTEVLSYVYQVRRKLFHGSKTPDNSRDQSLVTASYTIVAKLIQPLLDPMRIECWP